MGIIYLCLTFDKGIFFVCLLKLFLFIIYSIAECFAFLICTKWYNPAIHRWSNIRESGSSSMNNRFLDWNRGLVVSSDEDGHRCGMCNLQDVGGHFMKVPIIVFQILLFMRLEVW